MQKKDREYTVIIGGSATEMLVHHAKFLAGGSEAAARRLVSEFKIKAKTLETMPGRCPWLYHPLIPDKNIYGCYNIIIRNRYIRLNIGYSGFLLLIFGAVPA